MEGKTKCPVGIITEKTNATVPRERIWLWSDCCLVPSGSYSKLFIFAVSQHRLKLVKTITCPLSSQKIANLSGEIGLDLRNEKQGRGKGGWGEMRDSDQ